MRELFVYGLIGLAVVFFVGQWVLLWWGKAKPAAFGADDRPPKGTTAFNAAIVEAVGTRVDDAFKLKMLTEGRSVAEALKEARLWLEGKVPQ